MATHTLSLKAWAGALALLLAALAWSGPAETPRLTPQQSDVFRAWLTRMVAEQLRGQPNPRWTHRDCAGLIRFAVNETLSRHDAAWRQSNGLQGARLPPELQLSPAWQQELKQWRTTTATRSDFVEAWQLIQANTRWLGRDVQQARPGDLLYFDQGDSQHVMVWMGSRLVYHTGEAHGADNGMRSVRVHDLMTWKDSRWQPVPDNPNFLGVYRFWFLAP